MTKIETIRLKCLDSEAQKRFYCDVLGMRKREDGAVAYAGQEAGLLFEPVEGPYRPTSIDLYWKIAISIPNIDLAYRQLIDRGVEVGSPRQVGDIAYLAHFRDPEGFTIELLDHWFKGERPAETLDTQQLGGGPHLSLLTLRAAEMESVDEAIKAMGMTPLSTVPVVDRGFTLYFYAFTDERPPSSELYALENRTWVYQRPYTVLEIQHIHGAKNVAYPSDSGAGYSGTVVSATPGVPHEPKLLINSKS